MNQKFDYICGIDIGKRGGLAFLNSDGHLVKLDIMPESPSDLANIITEFLHKHEFPKIHYFVEHVHAMPHQGVVSMFSLGKAFGEVIGILSALNQTHYLVRPQTWTKEMHQGYGQFDNPKKKSLEICKYHFGIDNFYASKRCKKPHDGLIDAAVIALYGYQKLINEI